MVPSPIIWKTPARARCQKNLGLVRVTPWANFAVFSDPLALWSTLMNYNSNHQVSMCGTWNICSLLRIFVNCCQPKKRPTIWIWVHLLENLVISTENSVILTPHIDFCTKELYYHGLLPSPPGGLVFEIRAANSNIVLDLFFRKGNYVFLKFYPGIV